MNIARLSPNNHTVTQSSFKEPCTKLRNEYGVETGIDSSFNFATQSTDGYSQPSFAFSVQTEPHEPLWFYCRQTVKVPHCSVGAMLASSPAATSCCRCPLTALSPFD